MVLDGTARFLGTTKLLITADAGGSKGERVTLWKAEQAELAHEIGLEIIVCHYPPGMSKRNRISSTAGTASSPRTGVAASSLIGPSSS